MASPPTLNGDTMRDEVEMVGYELSRARAAMIEALQAGYIEPTDWAKAAGSVLGHLMAAESHNRSAQEIIKINRRRS